MKQKVTDPAQLLPRQMVRLQLMLPSDTYEEIKAFIEESNRYRIGSQKQSKADVIREALALHARVWRAMRAGKPFVCAQCDEEIV